MQCVADGKSIIIEGLHLDVGLYLQEFGTGRLAQEAERRGPSYSEHGRAERHTGTSDAQAALQDGRRWHKRSESIEIRSDAIARAATIMLQQQGSSLPVAYGAAERHSVDAMPARFGGDALVSRDAWIEQGIRAHGGPVFVPVVLQADPNEYSAMLHEWLAETLPGEGIEVDSVREAAVQRLVTLQEHLAGYRSLGVPVMQVGILDHQEILEKLHEYMLGCIELSLRPSG